MSIRWMLPFASALALACAGSAAPAAKSAPRARPDARVIEVPRQVVTPHETSSVSELYERGEARARSGDLPAAAADLDRAYALDPDGPLARDALFHAAEAWDLMKDNERALERYEQAARRFPDHELGREALVRAMRLLCYLERWQRAGDLADLFFTREPEPRPFDAVVALSSKALALVATGDDVGALRFVEKGRDVVETRGLDMAGKVPRDLAQLYFALGEVRRVRAERIKFSPLPPNFAQLFEQRCQLILDAQSAYSDTMRAYDSHWSAMAGYRVGELYQSLHADVMLIEPPKAADSQRRRQLFEGAMRLRYSVLLAKARGMMEHTLSMASRTGESSAWVERAQQAKAEIERAQAREQAALDRLPYSRAELQAALDRLAKGQTP
ncbi:MAG TPA: hypothetical protein VM686_19120 [Polyangiaceae bacterium]|nr:hypothetical protein [Polyangiaceae bacterium]